MTTMSGRAITRSSTRTAVCVCLGLAGFVPRAEAQTSLFFASDVHTEQPATNTKPDRTPALKSRIQQLCPTSSPCNVVALAGDYGTDFAQDNEAHYQAEYDSVRSAITAVAPSATQVLSQGNHDYTTTAGFQFFTHTGLATSGSNYEVFVINWIDIVNASAFSSMISSLWAECWTEVIRMQKVFFVVSHVPLHSSRGLSGIDGDLHQRLSQVAATLGMCSQSRNIVVLWGHNHSAPNYDYNINYVVPNSVSGYTTTLGGSENGYLFSEWLNAAWSFTYLNAGYIKPRSSDTSATLVTINSSSYTITRVGDQANTQSIVEARYAHWMTDTP